MQIKTYTERDLASALECARREFGSEALVVGQRRVRTKIGLPAIEITVAVDSRVPTDVGEREELTRLASEVRDLQSRIAEGFTPPRSSGATAPATADKAPREARPPRLLSLVSERLVSAGLSADLAMRFEAIATRDLGVRQDLVEIARATQRGLAGLLPLKPLADHWNTLLIVGPPETGESSVAAALASRCVRRSSDTVVWVRNADGGIRPRAPEPPTTDRISTRFTSFDESDELARLINDCDRNARVVIDAGGAEMTDDGVLATLSRVRDLVPRSRVVLMLPAGLSRRSATEVLRRFAPLEPSCSAISRSCESRQVGELVTALSASNLPLAFTVENGESGSNLRPATPARMARLLLGGVSQHGVAQ